jgi:hypothetical protein
MLDTTTPPPLDSDSTNPLMSPAAGPWNAPDCLVALRLAAGRKRGSADSGDWRRSSGRESDESHGGQEGVWCRFISLICILASHHAATNNHILAINDLSTRSPRSDHHPHPHRCPTRDRGSVPGVEYRRRVDGCSRDRIIRIR